MKWIVYGLGGGAATGLTGVVAGAFTDKLLYGVVVGAVAGMLVLGAFALKALGVAAAGPGAQVPPVGEAEPTTTAPPVAREPTPDAPPNPYPPIRDDELHKKLFEGRTVYIADFARKLVEQDLIDSVDLFSGIIYLTHGKAPRILHL